MSKRIIKFRAWDKENEVYLPPDEAFLIADKGLPARFTQTFGYAADDNLELEQYTGLKDDNGKEIYENDLLDTGITDIRSKERIPSVVCWNSNSCKYEIVSPDSRERLPIYKGVLGRSEKHPNRKLVIIGNIHEGVKVK